MLQILSGKFFNESTKTKEIVEKDILYSNIKVFGKIETDFWTLESINIAHGVSSYLLTLNGKYFEDTSRVYYPEASDQFRLLTAFWFKAILILIKVLLKCYVGLNHKILMIIRFHLQYCLTIFR